MLVLSTLHNLLSQVLALPHLHTAILLTPAGQLVSVASDPQRPKDEIRVVVGLAGEIWQETKDQGFGMVDSEVILSSCTPFIAILNPFASLDVCWFYQWMKHPTPGHNQSGLSKRTISHLCYSP